MKNPYDTLGISKSATAKEIKKAYRKLAIKYHPDKNPGDKAAEEKFKDVSAAYELLNDPEKKAKWDQFGSAAFGPGCGGGGGGGFGGTRVHFEGGDPREIFKQFFGDEGTDPFAALFGQMGGMGGRMGGMPTMFHMGGMGGMGGHPFANMTRGGMGGGVRSSHVQPVDTIPSGAKVILFGLRGGAEHNNKKGRIVRWENTKERYIVRLDSGQEFALRQINLVQLVEGIVLVGLSKPHLNGSKGFIRGWQPNKSRYVIQLSNGTSLAVMPCNVLLPKNTRVLLQGLSNTRFNGIRAKIVKHDQTSGRYVVSTTSRGTISVKLSNCRA